jgi:hypothetical protein
MEELDLGPLELELGGTGSSSLEEYGGIISPLEEESGIAMLELLGASNEAEDDSLSSSLHKTSNRLNLPSVHPKTAIPTKTASNQNRRIYIPHR